MKHKILSSFHCPSRKIILKGNHGNPIIGRIKVQTECGGLGRMWQLFGEETEGIIEELNEVLAA